MNEACRTYVSDSLSYLASAEPGIVVLSGRRQRLVATDTRAGADEETASTSTSAKSDALRAGLTSTVQGLQAAGHRVIITQSSPLWIDEAAWDPATCSLPAIVWAVPAWRP